MWFLKSFLASPSCEPVQSLTIYRTFQSLQPDVQVLSPEGAGDFTFGLHSHHVGGSRPEGTPGKNSQIKQPSVQEPRALDTKSDITSFLLTPLSCPAVLAYSATPSHPLSAVWRDSGEAGIQAFTLLPEEPVRESQPEIQK